MKKFWLILMVNKRKMSAESPIIPFKDAVIPANEEPVWRRGDFLRPIEETKTRPESIVGPVLIDLDHYINQNSNSSFVEFEEERVIAQTGYHAEVMRSHGCGVSSVYMVLSTLAGEDFLSQFRTVGEFSIAVLSLHKNDRVEGEKRIIGTPVFNLRSGWYHDALVYSAIHLAKILGFRVEGVSELEKVAGQMQRLLDEDKKAMVVISVSNEFWRLPTETKSVATHMVVAGGFKFDRYGGLEEICVTDPYAIGKPRVNEWIKVDDRIRKAFTGRALFFYK